MWRMRGEEFKKRLEDFLCENLRVTLCPLWLVLIWNFRIFTTEDTENTKEIHKRATYCRACFLAQPHGIPHKNDFVLSLDLG
jgi:hypothetical protein